MRCQGEIRRLIIFAFILCHTHTHAQNLVELGRVLNEKTLVYPSPKFIPFEFITKIAGYDVSGNWTAYNNIQLAEASGTHIVAPYLFNRDRWTVDQIPLEKLIGPCVVFDITQKVFENPLYTMAAMDVNNWISENGNFPNNSIVLIHTGWWSRYSKPAAYFGHPTNLKRQKYPSLRRGALQAMLNHAEDNNLQISGVGSDTPALDLIPTVEVQQLAASRNIYLIQNILENIIELPARGARLLVMPTKIKGGAAAPARVVATFPEET
ncbi:UNVERIFIED_CONTAM: hypothetical protein RMT77_011276 [Armadillidium vulgare]